MPSEELAQVAQWRRRVRVEDAAEFAHYGGPPRAPNLSIFFGDDRANYSTASSEHSAAAATPRAVAAAGTGGSSGALPGELRMVPQPTGLSAADTARAGLSTASAPPRKAPATQASHFSLAHAENKGATLVRGLEPLAGNVPFTQYTSSGYNRRVSGDLLVQAPSTNRR